MKIGIEIGSTKSSIGYEDALDIKIISNLGEETVPSIVSINNNEIVAGIDAYNNRSSNINGTITEIKRIIGKNYHKDNLVYQKYKNKLCYELIEEEDKPILIKIKEQKFSPEEIFAYIIKKLIKNGEKKNVFTKKAAVIAVPSCFGIMKRQLIKKAAKLAGINESKLIIINESSAAILAFEIFINKKGKKFDFEYNYDIFSSYYSNKSVKDEECSPVSSINNTNKLTIVFDLGGGCFDLALYSIEEKDNKLKIDMKATVGDPNFGGIDFDNILVDFCITEFCEKTKIEKEIIYKNKKSLQNLKLKCEIAKKILSEKEDVIINVCDFYNNEDLGIMLTRDQFDELWDDLYKKIIKNLDKLFEITKFSPNDINSLLLIGGSSKIPKIKQILIDRFTEKKLIYNFDNNKIIINGVVLYACEMAKKKKKIILNEIVPCSLGVEIANDKYDSFVKHGDKMFTIIKRNMELSKNVKEQFKILLKKQKVIKINFYEGESKFVKYNQKIGDIEIEIPDAQLGSIINYEINFEVDTNYILKIRVDVPDFKITKEKEIGTIGKEIGNKLKELKSKENEFNFEKIKLEINEYSSRIGQLEQNLQDNDKNCYLKNCCKCYDDILKQYTNYIIDDVIESVYFYTKELFNYYLQRLTITDKNIIGEKDIKEIISDKKKRMAIFIGTVAYMPLLLDIFNDLYSIDKNIFFEIYIYYMDLMNNEGNKYFKKNNKTGKDYSKIYFDSCEDIIKQLNEKSLEGVNKELKEEFDVQKKVNEFFIEYINESRIIDNKNLQKIIESLNRKKHKWLKDTLYLIYNSSNKEEV